MLVDAKIVNADPEHPLAAYEAGQELEGPAAELQVALGHAQALPAAAIAEEAVPEAPARPAEPVEASKAPETTMPEASAVSEAPKASKGRR